MVFCNCSYHSRSLLTGLPLGRPVEEHQHESKVAICSSRNPSCLNSADDYMYNTRYSVPWSECMCPDWEIHCRNVHFLIWMLWRLHMFMKILCNIVGHCRNNCGDIPDMRRLSGTLFPCGHCCLPSIWCSTRIDSCMSKVVEPLSGVHIRIARTWLSTWMYGQLMMRVASSDPQVSST